MKTFRQLFRPIFVIFSLYLLSDAFYRWDGFSYYATFPEFLPSIALASILWSITAVLMTIVVWLLFRAVRSLSGLAGVKVSTEQLLLYSVAFMLTGALAWKIKTFVWPYARTSSQLKLFVLISVSLLSVFPAWKFRGRAGRWAVVVQERITPLVWLFGIFVIFAVPLVAYQTWSKQTDRAAPGIAGRPPEAERKQPNIILITFDSLTALKMSVYGYQRETTPFMKEWAGEAVVFTKAKSESNFTTPSTASLMTGKRVWTHRTFHIEGARPVNSRTESLPSVLKKNGYFNMAFVVNPHTSVENLGMSGSFEIAPLAADFSEPASLVGWQFGYIDVFLYQVFGNKIRLHNWVLEDDFILKRVLHAISSDFSTTTVPPGMAFSRFLKSIDKNPQRPFFAWIHLFPPHDPYLPPEPFRRFFNPSSRLRTFKSEESVKLESYKYLFQYRRFPEEMQPAVDLMKDYYDEFIRYCDNTFREFIGSLERRGMDNTVIILSADHGESFEHGYFTHGGPFLYEQVTDIPLIIREPGRTKGRVVDTLVEQIDIPATILDLAGITVPSWMEGRSLVPAMRGEELPVRPAFSMNFEENRSLGHEISRGSVAVWDGDYKLIHYLEPNESLLFNLRKDPAELNDLFESEPDTGQRLLDLIRDNLQKANEKIRGGR